MNELLEKLSTCVEFGKINTASPYPPQMRGQEGAMELTQQALEAGIAPAEIMDTALIPAMARVGQKFTEGKIFVPQMLLSAKAMNSALTFIKPYFSSGEVQRKGTFIIGTVFGDLHDIGKNLVCMMVEGAGWEVIDLGVDVSAEKFIETLEQHPGAYIGLSALLTTTMTNMKTIIDKVHETHPEVKFIVGGAPVSAEFAKEIGADGYAADPQDDIKLLESFLNA
ncbi:MAG: corrinoid protein [Alistipes sp.]|nr:corrinoid protein [Alistipes sp.]